FCHAMLNPASLGSLYQLSNCLTKPAPPKKVDITGRLFGRRGLGSLYQLSNCLTKPAPPKKAASDVLNSEVSLENRLHERFYRFHCGDATSPKLDFVLTS